MTLLFGVASVVLVFAIVARMTRSCAAALLAGGLFAFSSTAWGHALLAEVYTFYMAALLGALYSALRWVQTNRVRWLMAAAVLYGICVGNRPSEIFAMPAFLALWAANRRRVALRTSHIISAAILAVLPFAVSVGYYWIQATPANLSIRDNAARDAAVDDGPVFHEMTGGAKLAAAVRYCLGLRWAGVATMSAVSLEQLEWDAGKYLWLASGLGAWGKRFPGEDPDSRRKQLEQGEGVNLTPAGFLLAGIALVLYRRRWRYTVPVALLVAGNLVFYLWHHPPDNLEFTLPSIAGLSILGGIGAAVPRGKLSSGWRRRFEWACLLIPVALLGINWSQVNEATDSNRAAVEDAKRIAALPFPDRATIVTSYPPAMRLRYALYVTAGRSDIRVVFSPGFYDRERRERMMTWLMSEPGPLFFRLNELSLTPAERERIVAATPRALADAGFAQLPR